MIRIAIADDHDLVRGGLRIMLEQHDDLKVVGEAATGVESIELARSTGPDVILMDVQMPELDGLAAMRAIIRHSAEIKVIMLTTYDLDEYVVAALRAGACGYLLKDVAPAELIRCVRSAATGETVLAQSVVNRLVDRYLDTAPERAEDRLAGSGIDRLSAREQEILAALARGGTNAEIARELFLSPATVKTHVAAVLAKLGLRDRVQAVILAYESGFVGRP